MRETGGFQALRSLFYQSFTQFLETTEMLSLQTEIIIRDSIF